eukprot:GDKK01008103.1.p1 GENE.GDKK01008103.1~~GDKK01008103.1.p1  ORF type:complete len:321 (-),score=53.96 GDKK01008103.1:77-1039(-)
MGCHAVHTKDRSIRTSPPTEELQRGVTPQEEEYADDADVGEHTHRGPAPKPEGPPKFITYDTDADGITTLKLNRAPVNSFSLEFFEEFTQWMMWMGDAEEIKAVVLSSNINAVFSAGLDIGELYQPKEDRFPMFWSAFQHYFITLHTFPKPLICAINGNSPAGGCITALGCDYRIMAKHPKDKPDRLYRIGLNETKLGLVAPSWAMASLGYVVGKRRAEKMLQLGETPTGEEALSIGLIDELVSEEEVIPRAVATAKKFLSVNNQARWLSRDMMRGEIMSFLGDREAQEQDIQFSANMVINPEVQKSLGEYLARLKGGKK